ncbi:hypothetical protein LUZ61_006098 [Rhynchospora tenuis]|uniref:Acid phosphatase/vanadium-dependent haloperoxidase-related protein n=1 Tax=Rhynchospora tenuis TaxID=198213 RepID=A0AAD5ZR26_9POAL|nr:hypothetical protein LUZ61_006098 [Rhynchospora tenuis]
MDEALTGALSETNSSIVDTIASSSSHHAASAASNLVLACALLAFFAAQLLKLIFSWLKEKRFDSRRFLVSGGMPSSICATVAALATAVGVQEGARTSAFALALIFASIVMYDASGIRFHAGRQAALLNQIVIELPPEHSVPNFRPLREPLGHTPLEVFVGAILGCLVSYLMTNSI